MTDVFFYEAFAEEAESLRQLLPAGLDAGFTGATIQESGHEQPPSRLISIRTQSQLPLAWAGLLDGILSRSSGYDHLAAYAAAADPVPALGYLPNYCHRAVAEQAMLIWVALLRRLPRQVRQFHTFHRDGLTGRECQGRTLAVVGVGNIGREVCRLGEALGMHVLGVDREPKYEDITYVDIWAALVAADVIVCAMDLNASNRGYFDVAKLCAMRRGAVFVNVSRGELSPSTLLLESLKSGQLGGAGLDVYDREAELAVALREGLAADDRELQATLQLAQFDNAICTPHNAFNSVEAVGRKSEQSVRQIAAFLATGRFIWLAPLGPTD